MSAAKLLPTASVELTTAATLLTHSRNRLHEVVAQIDDFDRVCTRDEYTDTGDAWQLLEFIREEIEAIAGTPSVRVR